MNELVAILLTAFLFALLGLLTRERPTAPRDTEPNEACGSCRQPCQTPETTDAHV